VVLVPIASVRLHFDQTRQFGQLALGIRLGAYGEREVEQLHRRIVGEGEEEVEVVDFEGGGLMSILNLPKDWFLFGLNQQGAVEETGHVARHSQ
jgi:hypothetical protein